MRRGWWLPVVVSTLVSSAAAGAETLGSNLKSPSQTDATCSSWFGTDSCMIWSSPYTLGLPVSGTVTAVRVRTGGHGGRMQVLVMRGQYQPDFSSGQPAWTFVCCFLQAYGPTFEAPADTVVTVPTSLRLEEDRPPPNGVIPSHASNDDFIALSVIDPGESLPITPIAQSFVEAVAPAPSPQQQPAPSDTTLIQALNTQGFLLNANVEFAPSSSAGASLRLDAPAKIGARRYFRIVASGSGTQNRNYLAVFFTLHHPRCPTTYAAATTSSHTILLQSRFVGRAFNVRLHPIHGGSPAAGYLCGYLYQRSSSPSWSYGKPEAEVSRKIRFTRRRH